MSNELQTIRLLKQLISNIQQIHKDWNNAVRSFEEKKGTQMDKAA